MICPKCGSDNVQIINETTTSGKDYSAGKGCLGFLITQGQQDFYVVPAAEGNGQKHPILGM